VTGSSGGSRGVVPPAGSSGGSRGVVPPAGSSGGSSRPAGKSAPEDLGIDPASLDWQSSGSLAGAVEVAMAGPQGEPGGQAWILMRVCDDPSGRVLVYDRHEWECFLDGVRNGEFDLHD
jgi:hypothetical protein